MGRNRSRPRNRQVLGEPELREIGRRVKATAGASSLIEGLRLVWVSATSITVEPGNAALPNGTTATLAAASTLTGLATTANTWFHVYLHAGGVEIVTTAPDVPYIGGARGKTGDTSRRYLGSLRTNPAGTALLKFHHLLNGTWWWLENPQAAPLEVISDGQATSPTAVSCAGAVPPTCRLAYCFISTYTSLAYAVVGFGDSNYTLAAIGTGPSLAQGSQAGYGNTATTWLQLNSSQQFFYDFDVDPGGAATGLKVDVLGYYTER